MQLANALGLRRGDMVSLIGAGGKTTVLFHLAKEIRDAGGKVLVTTTTKIFKPVKPHVDRLFLVQDADALVPAASGIHGPVIIAAGYDVDDEGKLIGLPAKWLNSAAASGQFDNIVIEADGAASRLFKVPSEIEPVIPENTNLTVWIMSIKVLGKPMHPSWIHRVERALAIVDASAETLVTKDHVTALVRHPAGCLKGVPSQARKIALINQADTAEDLEQAKALANPLLRSGFERV
jgi:probable selenium-dependent hydroxylase accessory protein YqeC